MKNTDENEIPLDFWIETVEGRVKVMGVDIAVETLGLMHFDEYSNRLVGESKKSKIDFAKSRMKGFADAYNHFAEEYSKINENQDIDKKYLESCIYHADASFIGAQLIAEKNGMNSDEIRKYIPTKKLENALKDILTGLQKELKSVDSFNLDESVKNEEKIQSHQPSKQTQISKNPKPIVNTSTSELIQRRVFIRDTVIKLIYTILASIFLYILYLFYIQYKKSTNANRPNSVKRIGRYK